MAEGPPLDAPEPEFTSLAELAGRPSFERRIAILEKANRTLDARVTHVQRRLENL